MRLTAIHLSPATQRWLRNSPVTPFVLIYLDYLTECRYADETSEHHLAGLAHLGLWMRINHFRIEELNEALVTQFLDEHLPICDCPRPIFQTPVPILAQLAVIFCAFCVIAVSFRLRQAQSNQLMLKLIALTII